MIHLFRFILWMCLAAASISAAQADILVEFDSGGPLTIERNDLGFTATPRVTATFRFAGDTLPARFYLGQNSRHLLLGYSISDGSHVITRVRSNEPMTLAIDYRPATSRRGESVVGSVGLLVIPPGSGLDGLQIGMSQDGSALVQAWIDSETKTAARMFRATSKGGRWSIRSASPIQAAPEARIFIDGADVTGRQISVVAGQKVTIRSNLASTRLSSWIITGQAVGGYSATQNAASITPIDARSPETLTLYFSAPASTAEVTLTSTDRSFDNASVSLVVRGPTNPQIRTTMGSVVISRGGIPWLPRISLWSLGLSNEKSDWLSLGNEKDFLGNSVSTGIQAAGWADQPDDVAGQFFWVQVVEGNRVVTAPVPSVGCRRGADRFPYPVGEAPDVDAPRGAIRMSDSPAGVLPNRAGDEAYKPFFTHIAIDMSFKLYLMWKPTMPDSIPISLGFLSWGWHGRAQATTRPTVDANGEWVLDADSAGYAGRFVPNSSFPTWTSSIYSIESGQSCD